jgi:glycosyltransferase involved in cell wall biosynthesis
MRILHVVPSYLPAVRYGGPIFAVHSLCQALAAKGHEVEVFTTNVDGPGISPVPVERVVNLDGVRVRYFSSPVFRRLYWSPGMKRALAREMSLFDVVHLHSAFLWPTWAAARSARKVGVPYVLAPRGMLIKDLILRRSRFVKSAWILLIERSNVEQAAAIHLTSDLEATELKRFGWRLPPLAVLPNGIDAPLPCSGDVSADVKAVASRRPLVLFLGRLSWKKGLDRLIYAISRSPAANLAIVGPDDEGLAPQLKRQAERLGISERVFLLPRTVVGQDKEYLFAAAQVFVLPSYSENFGNTVLEALRRGVPVVATPEVGAAEIVIASGGGIVAPGEPAPFAAAICKLISNPDLAQATGDAGKRHVSAHYAWPDIASRVLELYEGVRAKAGPR